MGSISPIGDDSVAARLASIAHQTALALGLPWDLQQLKKSAYEGAQEATSSRAASLGISRQQAEDHFARLRAKAEGEHIREQIRKRRTAEQSAAPSNEQIREALDTFSVQEWRDLIAAFDQSDVDALRSYLDANKGPLENRLGIANTTSYLATRSTGDLFYSCASRESA